MPFTPPYSALPQQDLYLPTLGARQHHREGGLAHLRNSGSLEREHSSRCGGGKTVLVRCVRRKPACRDLHTLGEYVNLQTAARSHRPGDRDLPDGVKPSTMRHCGGCLPPTRRAPYTLRISIYVLYVARVYQN
jgi:hypothetical protein